ncbi:MAG: sensor histidine kinase [Chloroflexi bacterium]|nr:MAG: sensor histidine kinase [Chloroflexota bacterium]
MASPPDNSLPTNIDFATDVKSDRLNILWRVTVGICVFLLIVTFTFAPTTDLSPTIWAFPPIILMGFCFATNLVLKRQHFDTAAIVYTVGWIAAITIALTETDDQIAEIVPFFFVPVVFMAGLLLRPVLTFLVAIVSAVLTVLVPFLAVGGWDLFGAHPMIAIILMFLSASLAAQVTGELYAVTEWALLNYQRERNSNFELFESRNELRRSLKRSQVLGERLQEANRELEAAKEAAEAAKNFRGQFLANMSHELRTPLNAIIGFSETMLKFPMMYDDEPLPQAYHADLNQIYTSGQQLLHLINDILDLARVDAGKLEIYMQRVELNDVIQMVLATANGLIGSKPIELKTDLPSPLPDVWADEARVRQVLLNLYSNAVKFTEQGSITLKIQTTDEGVQFSVTDTGSGIPENQLEAIFEEFKQAEGSGGRDPRAGSGLGLAISRQLLGLMNGRIWAESKVGEGSTFHFVLQPYHKDKVTTMETTVIPNDTGTVPSPLKSETSEEATT